MQQAQGGVKQFDQIRTCNPRCFGVPTSFKVKPRFDQLNVPVAKISPEEVIDPVCRLVKAIRRERLIYVFRETVESRENPTIFERHRLEPSNARVETGLCPVQGGAQPRRHTIQPYTINIHEHEPRRIPNLVSKVPIALRPALAA